jgi:hypothetical protein
MQRMTQRVRVMVSNEIGERESDKHCMVIDGKETVIANEAAGHTSGTNALRQEGPRMKHRPKKLRAT